MHNEERMSKNITILKRVNDNLFITTYEDVFFKEFVYIIYIYIYIYIVPVSILR